MSMLCYLRVEGLFDDLFPQRDNLDDDEGSEMSSGRRRAQYRQSPRWCSSRPGVEDDEESISQASVSVARSVAKAASPRIGKQQSATSFAAAIKPSSASPNKVQLSKSITTPLLGVGMSSATRKSHLGLSFKTLAGSKSSNKCLPPPAHTSSSITVPVKMKRKSIAKTIQAPLKSVSKGLAKVSSKVKKRGKKSSQKTKEQPEPSSPYKLISSSNDLQATRRGSCSIGRDLNAYGINNENVCNDANQCPLMHDIDLCSGSKKQDDVSPSSTPFSFDDPDIVNPFRSADSVRPQCCSPSKPKSTAEHRAGEAQDFSLNKALSPSNGPLCDTLKVSGSTESLQSDESLAAFEVWARTPSTVDNQEGTSDLELSNSDLSIPSLSGNNHVCTNEDVVVTQDANNNLDSAADSALAWGALVALMGSPAPKAVRQDNKKLKQRTNLWQGDATEDLDDVISLPHDRPAESPQALEKDANRLRFQEALEEAMHRREEGKKATPPAFYKSYQSTMARLSPASSPGRKDNGSSYDLHREVSNDSIPSLHESIDLCDFPSDIVSPQVPQDASAKEDAADSALAWGALAAILGSPAPKSLNSKQQKRRTPVNLWQDNEADDIDDIILFPHDDIADDCSIPSVSSNAQFEDDLVPNLGDPAYQAPPTPANRKTSDKNLTDSLAFTALAAVLGSPAPTSVVKKGHVKNRVNLWENGEWTDVLPEIEEDSVLVRDDSDILSVPSIDLNELDNADEDVQENEVTANSGKESSDSVLAWSALGMLLGSPAPKSLSKKSKKETRDAVRKLWSENESSGDILDMIPSIDQEEDDVDTWFVERGIVNGHDDDAHSIPSLSKMPSLSNTSLDEDEEPSSPSTSCSDFNTPLTRKVSSDNLADSVLAWSALAAFMGQPAPKSVLPPKRKKEVRDLWAEESDSDLIDLQIEISTTH